MGLSFSLSRLSASATHFFQAGDILRVGFTEICAIVLTLQRKLQKIIYAVWFSQCSFLMRQLQTNRKKNGLQARLMSEIAEPFCK